MIDILDLKVSNYYFQWRSSLAFKKTTFPLRFHYLSKEAFLEMLMRILNKQIQFKKHLLNIYQAPGLFRAWQNEKI